MKYLVTGAAGFIGSYVAKRLIEDGHDVVTIDNLSTGFKNNIPVGVHFIQGDAHDPKNIDKLENMQFEAIYHIAGQSGGIASFDNPIYDLNSNTASTLLLLDYAKNNFCGKFIYASSMSVYGDENELPVTENSLIKPKSFYAVGKSTSEHYMRIYTQFGIKSTALRLNNVYGPGQNMSNLRQGMVSIFLAQAVKNGKIHVMGPKERFRDFVFIDDVVNAFIASERGNENKLFNTYNVSTNIKTTCEDLIVEIQRNLPFPIKIEYEGSTLGDQFGIYCKYDNIKNNVGWEPVVTLKDGIKIMVDWVVNN